MPAFTVHIDKNSLGTLDGLERMVLIPEKFSGLALALGPIWLLWHRLFLALAGWGVFFVLTGCFRYVYGFCLIMITCFFPRV